MKNLIKAITIGGALLLGSCSLDTEPRQSLTPETALSTVEGLEALGLTAYGTLRGFNVFGQQMVIAPEIMADNLRIIANTGRYIGQEANADRAHMGVWNGGYWTGINTTNIVLAGIDDVEGPDDTRAQVKGTAHFLRAMFYFNMARIYGYEPGKEVNGWDRAVVIRTTPTLGFSDADFRERSSNREVYDLVIADLQAAINLLPDATLGNASVYEASRGAAQALLARVYLYDSKFAEAEQAATAAMTSFGITDQGVGLMDADGYVAGFSTFPNPESLFEIEIRSVDWSGVDGVNNSVCSLASNVFPSAQFIVSGSLSLFNSYEEGDIRATTWTETTRTGADGTIFRSEKWAGAKGDFLENLPIIRASEMFLIRAEARYRQSNEDGARADLSTLRMKRGLGAVEGTSGDALFDLIMNERRVEFAMEGHRWFDLKRNGMTITKHADFEDVPYEDYRILAPLPIGELQLNELLVDNPGYN